MDGQTIYVHRHSKNSDFPLYYATFTKALRTNRRTDGPTDRRTNQRTDIPSYRDAIAASKNIFYLSPIDFCYDMQLVLSKIIFHVATKFYNKSSNLIAMKHLAQLQYFLPFTYKIL